MKKQKKNKKLKKKQIKKTRKKRGNNNHKSTMSFMGGSNGHMKKMGKDIDELQKMEEEFTSLEYRNKITNELNTIIGSMKKNASDPFNYKGRQVGLSFTNPLGEPWSKDDDYLPEDIQNGSLGVHTFETISQSRVLGIDEGTHGSTGMIHYEGDEPVWNIGCYGSVWCDLRYNETPYRVHYISKHHQDKKRPINLIVENMGDYNPIGELFGRMK